MKFEQIAARDAAGTIAAHAVRRDGLTIRKGEAIGAAEVAGLLAAGVSDVIVARLEAGDIGEDDAARQLAGRVCGAHLSVDRAFTGRANLFAQAAGVLCVDMAAVDRINEIDEAVTFATLPAFRAVVAGEMVATVKIIPFAVPQGILGQALAAAGEDALRVAAYRPLRVGVISTLLPGLKPTVIAKTLQVLEARLKPAGARIAEETRVAHDEHALAQALRTLRPRCDLTIVFGASAITDRRDVIPAAIELAGGKVDHFGMPVDPGNLLLIGQLDGGLVIGAPGCARSPKENGFDWVLQRMLAGVPVTGHDIRRMGAGGLLMEIVTRPQPREGDGSPAHGGKLGGKHG